MENKLDELIEYELFDDAIILAEELNNISRDEKWVMYIAKALYKNKLYYRCCLCLDSCQSVESMILKARCYINMRKYKEALSIMEQIDDDTYRTAPFLKLMGDVYMKLDQKDMAKKTYLESFEKDSTLVSVRSALHHLGVNVEDNETYDSTSLIHIAIHTIGVADYNIQTYTQPKTFVSPLSLYYQFIYFHDTSQYIDAEKAYSALHYLLPWWKHGNDRYSSILYVLKRKEALTALATEATYYEPACQETELINCNLSILQNKETALTELSSLCQTYPLYVYAFYLCGEEYLQRGDISNAFQSLREAIKLNDKDYRIWISLGDCYTYQKEYKTALAHYMNVLTIYPTCTNAYCRIVQTWIQLNDFSMAQIGITKGLSIDKENLGLLLLQAQLYKIEKQYKEAIFYYEKVRSKCDVEISIYMDLAQCYHELGDIAESKRLLYLASKIDSEHQSEVITLLREYDFEKNTLLYVCYIYDTIEIVITIKHKTYEFISFIKQT